MGQAPNPIWNGHPFKKSPELLRRAGFFKRQTLASMLHKAVILAHFRACRHCRGAHRSRQALPLSPLRAGGRGGCAPSPPTHAPPPRGLAWASVGCPAPTIRMPTPSDLSPSEHPVFFDYPAARSIRLPPKHNVFPRHSVPPPGFARPIATLPEAA